MKRTRYFGIIVVLFALLFALYTFTDWTIAQTDPTLTPTFSIEPTESTISPANNPSLDQAPITDTISSTLIAPSILDTNIPPPTPLSTPITSTAPSSVLQPTPTLSVSPPSTFQGEADPQMTNSVNALLLELETENKTLQNQVASLEQRVLLLSILLLGTVFITAILMVSNIRLKRVLSANKARVASQNLPRTQSLREPSREKRKTPTTNRNGKPILTSSGEWTVVGTSAIGKDHIKFGKPCQDSFHYELLRNGWGIAIVADGAGSAQNSHLGSAFVAKQAARRYFRDLVIEHEWYKGINIPSEQGWQTLASKKWEEVRGALEVYAQHNDVSAKSLACTAIVVIFSPSMILVTHIGDGRAGYRNDKNEWRPLIKPYKGEEANSTIFLTSINWREEPHNYIESKIINDQITAFTLMSDGCEKHAFECSKVDADDNWSDPNLPYPRFFEPLVNNLLEMKAQGENLEVIHEKWGRFLESGTKGLEDEPDDKTLILGVLVN
jgi:hypothetical protein